MYRKDVDFHLAETFAHHWRDPGKSRRPSKNPNELDRNPRSPDIASRFQHYSKTGERLNQTPLINYPFIDSNN